jgi:hypothetical protein
MAHRPKVRFSKDYELLDVVALFRRRPWASWAEIVTWLRTSGPSTGELTPGEVARMVADFSVLDEENVPFTSDPGTAYEVAQAHRRTGAVLEALTWIEQVQALGAGETAA